MALMLIGHIEILPALFCFLFLLLTLRYWTNHRNAVVPTNWSLVGMMPGLLKNVPRIHDFATEALKSCKGTMEFKGPWFANHDFWVTSDPINVRHILNTGFANYPKGPEFKKMFEPFGDGIINSDSDLWRNRRRMYHMLIGQSKYEAFIEKTILGKVVDGLIPLLDHVIQSGIQVDLQDVFQRLTFDNICLLVLGFDPRCLSTEFPKVACKKAFDDVEEIIFHRHFKPESWWKLQRWLQIGGEKKLNESLKVFDDFIYKCIASKRHQLCKFEIKDEDMNFDMLTTYIKKQEEKQEHIGGFSNSDKFLRDTALNLMVAGGDTISAGLTWFFWLVSTHPHVEAKILEEMEEKLGAKLHHEKKCRAFFSVKEVNKLVYFQAALCETLRLYPPIPINHRASSQVDTLPSGHHVKANQKVLLFFFAMGRMEEIWGKDCLEFKPERWISSDGGGLVSVPTYKFTAYNAGPQTCLGKNMSLIVMKVVAATMLWNYRVEVAGGLPISPSLSIVLYMKHGLKVSVSHR
ncbi:alkane hydroxylase MAH1-like [Ziziphus jujuba]|uniref:Alkane hydroxylase MAH1-like n=1 Tax=Ziziphus jujuba TaxID=326968 RepID=A0A6P3YW13_ZIZJJ|nr:alkane hydroxylase MAH1-like [Ziziphus jujuba]